MKPNHVSWSFVVTLIVLLLSITSTSAQTDQNITVRAGTKFKARLETPISSKLSEPGDNVIVTLDEPILLDNGRVVPRGMEMTGKITSVKRPGRVKGRAELYALINQLKTQYGSETIFVSIDSADDFLHEEKLPTDAEGKLKSEKDLGDDAEKARRGASFGAVVSVPVALANQGHNVGAAIAIPAGGALAGILLSRGKEIRLNAGSRLRMKFDKDLVLPISTTQTQSESSASNTFDKRKRMEDRPYGGQGKRPSGAPPQSQ
jgi:type IV secretion system protein VirB10